MSRWVDLGEGHAYSLTTGRDSDVPIGALVKHPLHDDDEVCQWHGECIGSIYFAIPEAEPYVTYQKADGETGRRATWQLVSLDPLHVEPSLACHCGDHGYIRDGAWVVA